MSINPLFSNQNHNRTGSAFRRIDNTTNNKTVNQFQALEYQEGAFEGKGIQSLKGRIVYQGDMENQKRHGRGIHYEENHIYLGYFQNNQYNGRGLIMTHPQGINVYIGNFKNGLFHGKGTLYDQEGWWLYKGDFEDGVAHGTGIQYSKGTPIYEGSFHKGGRLPEKLKRKNDLQMDQNPVPLKKVKFTVEGEL